MWSVLFSELFDLVNLAQSRDLPRAIRSSFACSCGAPVRDCAEVPATVVQAAHSIAQQPRLLRFLQQTLLPLGGVRRKFFDCYLHDRRGEDSKDIIDSSKSVRHLLLLRSICGVKPVVLVFQRPQKDIARSWKKRGRSKKFIIRILLVNQARMLVLHLLSMVGLIELLRFDFHAAVQEPGHVINEVGQAISKQADVDDGQWSFGIRWELQHIFPPADPEYLDKRTDIVVRSRG